MNPEQDGSFSLFHSCGSRKRVVRIVVHSQTFQLILGVHATLGDQQDRSQDDQDGAADVGNRGAHAAGAGELQALGINELMGQLDRGSLCPLDLGLDAVVDEGVGRSNIVINRDCIGIQSRNTVSIRLVSSLIASQSIILSLREPSHAIGGILGNLLFGFHSGDHDVRHMSIHDETRGARDLLQPVLASIQTSDSHTTVSARGDVQSGSGSTGALHFRDVFLSASSIPVQLEVSVRLRARPRAGGSDVAVFRSLVDRIASGIAADLDDFRTLLAFLCSSASNNIGVDRESVRQQYLMCFLQFQTEVYTRHNSRRSYNLPAFHTAI